MENLAPGRASNSLLQRQSVHLSNSSRVTITTVNGSKFTGVLHSVDETAGKITLKNVTTAGVKLFGPQIYYCNDMADLQIISDDQDVTDILKPSDGKKSNKGFKQRKCIPAHLSRLKSLDTDRLVLSNIFRDELRDQGIGSEEDNYEDFYKTQEYTLICRVSDKFDEAIEYIMEQEAVGVEVNGQKIGRDGILSLVQVATDSELIVFDMLRLGDEAFKAGLQAVFEAENVMKVMHDCRWISDLLRCQHDIAMVNIFDTQVANAFVYRSLNSGDWPRYVESLPGCLIGYLNLSPHDVQFTKIRERCKEKDEAVWLLRPLPDKLLSMATKNCVHLLSLQRALLTEMLVEFRAAVEIYLGHVSGTDRDVEVARMNSHLLPDDFTNIHTYVKRQSRDNFERSDPHCYDNNGFRRNNVPMRDKEVVFSHDSVWHKAHHSLGRGLFQNLHSQNTPDKSRMAAFPAEEKHRVNATKPAQTQHSPQKSGSSREAKKPTHTQHSPQKCGSGQEVKKPTQTQHSPQNCGSGPHVKNTANEKHRGDASKPLANKQSHSVSKKEENVCAGQRGESNCSSSIQENLVCGNKGRDTGCFASSNSPHDTLDTSEFTERLSNDQTVESHTESVSESDSIAAMSKSVGAIIKRSGLWRMTMGHEGDQASPSSLSSIPPKQQGFSPSKQQPDVAHSERISVVESELSLFQSCNLTEQEKEQAKELAHKMALLDQLHFVPAMTSAAADKKSLSVTETKSTTVKKLNLETPPDQSNISFMTCDNNDIPELIPAAQQQSSLSLGSSDSEESGLFCVPTESDLRRESSLGSSAFIPAGMLETKSKKKKRKSQQESYLNIGSDPLQMSSQTPRGTPCEPDFSAIPTPQSLSHKKEHSLGVSCIGIGDPFSEDEGFSTAGTFNATSSNTSALLLKSRLATSSPEGRGDEHLISDDELDKLLKSEKSQRILKLASMASGSTNVKDKILPIPAKAKSPSCGS